METRKFDVLLFLLVLILALAGVEAQKPSDSMSTTGGDSWEGDSSNVSPSMAVVIVVLVLGFFITGCISIYIQHCVDTSLTTTTSAAINNRNVNSMNKRGLDQSVIDTFPIFPYSAVKELKIGKGALECAVCLSEFQEDETLRFLPKCDHVFHSECIDPWLSAHATCPVCRDDLSHLPASSGDPSESSNHAVEVRIAILEAVKLPRAHSTGHSMTRDGENCERYTLRLPAEVRRELMARSKLKRAMSLVALPRQTSSRRGYRDGEGSGSSRYGRFFGRSILMRVASFRSTVKVGVDGVSSAGEKVPKSSSPTDQSVPHPLP